MEEEVEVLLELVRVTLFIEVHCLRCDGPTEEEWSSFGALGFVEEGEVEGDLKILGAKVTTSLFEISFNLVKF